MVGVVLLGLGPPAAAQDFRSGLSAFNRGDYIAAFRHWLPLAEGDDAPAQAGLGYLFYMGLGATPDDGQAAYWFARAAEHGQAEGQMLLGTLYFHGKGVPQSYVLSFVWCEFAQLNGHEGAYLCRDAALEHMTGAEMKESFRLVAEWVDRYRHRVR